jgi:glycerol-3-phosphate dehydrogenase (NAD(P)+)
MGLARGKKLGDVLRDLGSTAEGVRTTRSVWEFARARGIYMPITEAVYRLVQEEATVQQVLEFLMKRPPQTDNP